MDYSQAVAPTDIVFVEKGEEEEKVVTPVKVVKKPSPVKVPVVGDILNQFINVAEQRDSYVGLPYWLWGIGIYFVFLK